jgi:WD40 repeat protein
MAFSPDGKTLAVAVGNVHLYDPTTGKETAVLDSKFYVDVMVFAPDGKTLAVAGVEWESETNRQVVLATVALLDVKAGKILTTHRGTTVTANRGLHQLSGSRDTALWTMANTSAGGVIVWDPLTGKEEILLGNYAACYATLAPDGKTLAALHAGGDGKMVLSLFRRGGKTDPERK